MSHIPQDGGPAFPRVGHNRAPDMQHDYHEPQEGMSLRDWFAGQALSGALANADYRAALRDCANPKTALVAGTYEIADAMIAERCKAATPDASYLATARAAISHINSILAEKDRASVDIEVGSTALKSLIHWAHEAQVALNS